MSAFGRKADIKLLENTRQTLHPWFFLVSIYEESYTGGGHILQSGCPPSRFPYIVVKFGAARRKWTDLLEVGVAGEDQLGMLMYLDDRASRSGQEQRL